MIKYYSLLITKKKINLVLFDECWKLVNLMLGREMFIPSFFNEYGSAIGNVISP